MKRGFGFRNTLLSLSIAAVLSGCGGPGVTENPIPTTSGNGGTGTTPTTPTTPTSPTSPGTGTNPGATTPTIPNPPSQAIGEAATANANPAVLTNTATTVYPLNSAMLGSAGWRPTALLESAGPHASSPRVSFDGSGNGFAIWAQASDIIVRRYVASTATWSAPVILDTRTTEAHQPRLSIDRQSGNAVATWTQNDGTAESIYASRYDNSTSTWSAPQVLENTNLAVEGGPENSAVALRGENAAAAWRQTDGTAISIYLSRLVNGSWTTPVLIDSNNEAALHPDVAIDGNGNVTVAWRQRDPSSGEYRINTRRWNNSTQTLGTAMAMNGNGDRQHRLQFDAAGNGFLIWRGGGVFVRRFDVTSGTWSSQIALDNLTGNTGDAQLSVDPDGNAMVAWIESDGVANSVYARRYSAFFGTWGNAQLLENSNVTASIDRYPTVSMNGNEAVVAWVEESATSDAYATKMSGGTWGPVVPLENRGERLDELTSAIDAAGSANVLFVQADGGGRSIWQARYQSSNYVVPNGATWQSLANTLYGVNSVEAGNALQVALGGGTLTAGAILSVLPATLSVTTNIPAYYTVLATDTWSHIAQTVYGVTDTAAIAQLQTLLGNPTLTTGMQLVVPTVIGYITSGNYSAPLNWNLVNTTATTYHQLNAGALTVPLNNWSTAQLLETDYADASSPRVSFDASGNGLAVWAQASDVIVRRYTANTATWSAPVVLDTNPADAAAPKLAMDRTTGDAVVSWTQSDGVANSRYVSSFNASTNSWSVAMLLETTNNAVSDSLEGVSISKSGNHAAVAWLQSDGTVNNIYLSRLVAGTWTAPALVDTNANPALHPEVAIDPNGNVALVWRQFSTADGEYRIHARRWNNTTLAFSADTMIDGDGDRQPRLALDAQGNGFALWRGPVFVSRLDGATGTWGTPVQISGPNSVMSSEISVDAASGDALVTWVEQDSTGIYSVYARHYDNATTTWGATVLLENSNDPASTDHPSTVSLVNGSGVVAWIQEGARANLYAARFGNGTWGPATLLETRDEVVSELASSVDAANNATVLWIQPDGASPSVYQARSNGTPYYAVPAASTWQSLANTLYGVNSVAAAEALQTAMGNPTLTTGLQLQSLPATLVVTPAVPTYYVVQSGDTWASITLALYGTNAVEAATALQTVLSNPTLTVGSWLLIPSTLSYTVAED